MGNLVNEELLTKLKLQFTLFSLSDDSVPVFVFRVKNKTGPESVFSGATWECELVNAGAINIDGEFVKNYMYDFGNEIKYHPMSPTLSSPIIERKIKIDRKNSSLEQHVQLILEYAEFLDFRAYTTYETEEVVNDKTTKAMTTRANSMFPFDTKDPIAHWGPSVAQNEERYVVVIFPNIIMPPLIRVYNNLNFDIVNIDDIDCIYNSYSRKINVSTETQIITKDKKELSSVPVTKFNDHFKEPLTIYGQENHSIENGCWEIYSNEAIDLEISYNSSAYGVLDIRFGKYNLTNIPDKCTEEFSGNIDDIIDFISEIIDDNNVDCSDINVTRSKVSPDGSCNRIKVTINNKYIATLHSAGVFSVGILYIADIESNIIYMYLVDLQDQAIISTTKLSSLPLTNLNSNENCLQLLYEDNFRNLKVQEKFQISEKWNIKEISKLPVNLLIWEIHKQIEGSTNLFYSAKDSIFNVDNGEINDFTYPILGKHFARGLFGELIELVELYH